MATCPICLEEIEDVTCNDEKPLKFHCEPCRCQITEDQYYRLMDVLNQTDEEDYDYEDEDEDEDDYEDDDEDYFDDEDEFDEEDE